MTITKQNLKQFFISTLVIFISCILVLLLVEFIGRVVLRDSANTESRPYEPYFVSGDYYGCVTTESLLKSREGPEAYGYQKHYGLYFYEDRNSQWNAHRRSDFLFDHYLSRYSAEVVDNIIATNPRTVRIFVIGGSVAVGSSASSKNNTWHAQLEKSLRKEFHNNNIYVFNAAMGAFVSTQERLAFDLAIAARNPHIVVILDGFNDILIPLELAVAPGDPLQLGKRYAQIYDLSLWRFSYEHSVVLKQFHKQIVSNYLEANKISVLQNQQWSSNLIRGIVQTYTENVTYLLNRGRQMDIPVIFFFQPWKALSTYQVHGQNRTPEIDFQLSCYNGIKANLQMSEASGGFIDLTDIFNTDESLKLYTDLVHVNDQGQEILSENIAKVLKPYVKSILVQQASNYE